MIPIFDPLIVPRFIGPLSRWAHDSKTAPRSSAKPKQPGSSRGRMTWDDQQLVMVIINNYYGLVVIHWLLLNITYITIIGYG